MVKKSILAGSILVIFCYFLEAKAAEYVVRPGETLTKIAWEKAHSVDELVKMNNISSPDQIQAGQKLIWISPADMKYALAWVERGKKILGSGADYEFFNVAAEDLSSNNIRYSIYEPSGIYYGLILNFAAAEKIERIRDSKANVFNQQNHPEIQSGEVWITNADDSSFSKIGWTTKRKGIVAFDRQGIPISQNEWPGCFPVFAQKSQLTAAGVTIK